MMILTIMRTEYQSKLALNFMILSFIQSQDFIAAKFMKFAHGLEFRIQQNSSSFWKIH